MMLRQEDPPDKQQPTTNSGAPNQRPLLNPTSTKAKNTTISHSNRSTMDSIRHSAAKTATKTATSIPCGFGSSSSRFPTLGESSTDRSSNYATADIGR
ncbi:hypothetical protein BC829DRAFT_133896 [Chytridium lagenaria]|nr:hypothetical protein BC829DRAFT_133896 [Chytridium lagenaria]